MKKKIRVVLFAVILIVLAGCYSIVDKNNAVYDKKVDNSDYVATVLLQDGTVTQEFVSKENALDGVSMKLAATGDIDAIDVSYNIVDVSSGQIVAKGKSSLEKLKSGKFFKFKFSTINDTKNKSFEFTMRVDACDKNSSVTVYQTPRDADLVLRAITHRFDIETFVVSICFLLYIVLFIGWLYKLFK